MSNKDIDNRFYDIGYTLRYFCIVDKEKQKKCGGSKFDGILKDNEIVDLLNELHNNNLERNKNIVKLLNKIEKIHATDINIMQFYAERYKRNSKEFELICEIADSLGVPVCLLQASDDLENRLL